MTTQVIFKIDKKIKEQAMKKAQSQGLPFAVVLKLATNAFVRGELSIGLVDTRKFNSATSREMRSALKDIASGKNLSPRWHSAKEAAKHLSR